MAEPASGQLYFSNYPESDEATDFCALAVKPMET